jgi:hypothetical protein
MGDEEWPQEKLQLPLQSKDLKAFGDNSAKVNAE